MAGASVLQQDWTVTVHLFPLVAVARLLLAQEQEGLRRDQVGTVQKHTRRLQHTAAGQNLNTHTHTRKVKFKGAMWLNEGEFHNFRQKKSVLYILVIHLCLLLAIGGFCNPQHFSKRPQLTSDVFQ